MTSSQKFQTTGVHCGRSVGKHKGWGRWGWEGDRCEYLCSHGFTVLHCLAVLATEQSHPDPSILRLWIACHVMLNKEGVFTCAPSILHS